MNLEMLGLLSALIRNGLVVAQSYHRACRENRNPALTPRSRLYLENARENCLPPLTPRSPQSILF